MIVEKDMFIQKRIVKEAFDSVTEMHEDIINKSKTFFTELLFRGLQIPKDPIVLDFDHSGNKIANVSDIVRRCGSIKKIDAEIKKIKAMGAPIVACCASGMRSGSAASILKDNDIEAINGGGWQSLQGLMNSTK